MYFILIFCKTKSFVMIFSIFLLTIIFIISILVTNFIFFNFYIKFYRKRHYFCIFVSNLVGE